jgi:hypothetical protein
MKIRKLSFILLFVWIFPHGAHAAPPAENTGKIPTVTRLVKLFYERESELLAAFKSKNRQQLNALVAEDFELRGAPAPASPVPRGEWLAKSLAEADAYAADFEQIAVHGLTETAIVSFLWRARTPLQAGAFADIFVVDVWRLIDSEWKLSIRYVSPSSAADSRIPGFAPPDEAIDKRF